MKITMIGGGAHRVLPILRSTLAIPGVMEEGEIEIFDLDPVRAEAMGLMIKKSPEWRNSRCVVHWGRSLEIALNGADVVGTIMPALSPSTYLESHEICRQNGFISSDNVSPTGALCAVRIAPVVLEIARKMEQYCPDAWLVNFVNPVAVVSGMINNHTSIRALGVCEGFANHLWDISRIFGDDSMAEDLDVAVAGINHLSYILDGKWRGEDLLDAISRRVDENWRFPVLSSHRTESEICNIKRNVSLLVRFWKELGVLVFSTEPDGMNHLMYKEAVAEMRPLDVAAELRRRGLQRNEAERTFGEMLGRDLDEAFWNSHWKTDRRFGRADNDVFVRIFCALAGVKEVKIVTSRLNNGAVQDIDNRNVVEYSQRMFRNEIIHEGPSEVPKVVHELTCALAKHQTLLGDALAAGDPELLAAALVSYPIEPFSKRSKTTFRQLLKGAEEEIAPRLRETAGILER